MGLEQAMSTPEIREMQEKLRKLREHMPDADELMCKVGTYFAERLNRREQISPLGFVMEFKLMVYDLMDGANGLAGKPIPQGLTGYTPEVYTALLKRAPILAQAVAAQGFAESVRNFYKPGIKL
ncbi:MAG: hypothetical protein AB1668_02370 [Nanoarchaeota archaeon]